MNIYQILQSKPHNLHYLNRYYKFIQSCIQNNATPNNVDQLVSLSNLKQLSDLRNNMKQYISYRTETK